ncbi:MAG: hypothetical protein [Caudoviricetes sp.]|nr:MAG: hypothetical protein [Caudoviricetes sp.]
MILDSCVITPEGMDTAFPVKVEMDSDTTFPFEIIEDGGDVAICLSTAEAKALLKFLKKHLEPKLENV